MQWAPKWSPSLLSATGLQHSGVPTAGLLCLLSRVRAFLNLASVRAPPRGALPGPLAPLSPPHLPGGGNHI